MALEATHIRFALDVKDKYQVTDIKKYITGTIYPDSRNFTKLDRALSHPKNFLEWDILNRDDFDKGWFVHLLCDKIQINLIIEKFPEFFSEKTIEFGHPDWINLTAAKVIQDLDDAEKCNIKVNLPMLDLVEAKNGEDEKLLKEYYKRVIDAYSVSPPFTLQNHSSKMGKLGTPPDVATRVQTQAQEFFNDEAIKSAILELYPEMLKRAAAY